MNPKHLIPTFEADVAEIMRRMKERVQAKSPEVSAEPDQRAKRRAYVESHRPRNK